MKILVVGRSFGPGRGSEPGFTWNWAKQWSRQNDVWVIAHPEFRKEVDAELRRAPIPGLRIEWVELWQRIDPWQLSKHRLGMGLHYIMWQEVAFRRARTLHARIAFDFVHHVSLGTVSAPPKLWRLGIPFVWGPVGGGQASPVSFVKYFRGEKLREMMRCARLKLLPLFPALRKAARRSMVLATNRETMAVLKKAGAKVAHLLLDGALPSEYIPEAPIKREARAVVTLMWAGAFVPRKGLPLALEALAQTDSNVRLVVAGAGRKEREWQRLTIALGLGDRVQFLGLLSSRELNQRFSKADGFLFTSIRDSFGTVLLEAMAHALPVIALDHQGVAAHLPSDAAIKIPVTHPDETVAALASAIRLLASSPEMRDRIGRAGWKFAKSQLWESKVAMVERLISPLIARNSSAIHNV